MIVQSQKEPLTLEQASLVSSLFEKYRKAIFLYLYNFTHDPDLTDDFVAEVFEKVIRAIQSSQYIDQDKPAAWLYRIAHNVFIDYTRRSKKLPVMRVLPGMEDDPIDGVSDKTLNYQEVYINAEITKEVRELIDKLPLEQREVIVLRMYVSVPFKEIAKFQEVSINTSLGRMRHALVNLRRLIRENNLCLDGYTKPD